LSLPKHKRILEIGCGRGVALSPLARLCRPTRLVGLDVDLDLLSEAKGTLLARGIQADLVHEDVRRMTFPDESFDVIIDFGTCYHIQHSSPSAVCSPTRLS
jgi:ubiquinone/menaquinone biosynthesis C-methylase UbiE